MVAGSDQRNRTAPLLEWIALRHQNCRIETQPTRRPMLSAY
jgi:hypothetical protein